MFSRKVIVVIKREYLTKVRTKSFIIISLLAPVLMIFFMFGVFIFQRLFEPDQKSYYLIDQTGRIASEFIRMLPDTTETGERQYNIIVIDVGDTGLEDQLEGFRRDVLDEKVDGYIIIPEDVLESRRVTYASTNVSNVEEQGKLRGILSQIVTNIRIENLGISPEDIRREMAQGRIRLDTPRITEEGEVEASGRANILLTTVMGFLLYFLLIFTGVMLMQSVLEEKTQRITETIIASIDSFELMTGKLIGVCALGITQIIIMIVFVLGIGLNSDVILSRFGVNSTEIVDIISQIDISFSIVAFFVIYFILGYLLYASMFAAIGAIVNTTEEAVQLQFFVMMPIIIHIFLLFSVSQNP
ncbi:ABC transporter permease, partial [candidate division KSB1 bacterium]|nr:ABC transporter permease [candidate division KSB1 bacterium]